MRPNHPSGSRGRNPAPSRLAPQRLVGLLGVLCLGWLLAAPLAAFTYQGQIHLGEGAEARQLDVVFTLFDAADAGRAVGAPIAAEGVAVGKDGSFEVDLDFGRGFDARSPLWLEVHIIKAGSFGPFAALKPRRQVAFDAFGELALASSLAGPSLRGALAGRNVDAAGLAEDIAGRIPDLQLPGAQVLVPVLPPRAGTGSTLQSDLSARAAGIPSRVPGQGIPGASGTLQSDLSPQLKSAAEAVALYTHFGWRGSSGPVTTPTDVDNLTKVLRITEEATSNLFEVDLNRIRPGTLITNLPITITEPGYYYLIGNLSNTTTNGDGITIDADNVTIDMQGYTLYGGKISGINSDDGIFVAGSQTNIKIYNGGFVGWQGDGVNALNADFSIFKDLHVGQNDGDGLVTDFNCIMDRITAFSNGLDGVEGDDGSVITDCTAGQNGDNGIQTSEGCVVVNCASFDNESDGIDVAAGSVVQRSVATDNGIFGFDIALGGQAVESTAYDNMSNGFDMASACILRSCISSLNNGHGVRTFANSWITYNKFHENDLDGIRISSTDVHVEGNQVTDNDQTGINNTASGSFFVRNTAAGNVTNYNIDPNSTFGPIIDVTGIGSLTNNAAADHPWANFSF